MRRFLTIIFLVFTGAAVIFGVLLIVGYYRHEKVSDQKFQTSSGYAPATPAQIGAVRNTFQSSIPSNNPDRIKPRETVIADKYALQSWGGDVMGGQALLKYDARTGSWAVVDFGGGAWSVEGLVAAGVPRNEAEALVNQASQ